MRNTFLPLFICMLLSGCLSKQPEWKKKDVQVDLSGIDTVERNVKTTEVEDLDNNKLYSYDDIEEEEIIVEDYQAASVFDDEVEIAAAQLKPIIIERIPSSLEKNKAFTYTLKNEETLMLVAWSLYGDYTRWREIKEMNPYSSFQKDETIQVPPYDQIVEWNPGGDSYLILKGDTLGKISQKRYDTKKYWKDIWKHNKRLIKNPNLIFAGFTIFTVPLDKRQIASENQ